jgi:hypothetical protein
MAEHELTPMSMQIELVESGRTPGQIDQARLLFGCAEPGCPVKIEHIVDIAACLAIFQAHQVVHGPEYKDAKVLAGLFDVHGQPLTATKGGLDT